jgi:hypothetical protein
MRIPRFSAALLPAALTLILVIPGASAPADPVQIKFDSIAPAIIQQRLERVTRKLADRRAALESLFQEVGCQADRLTEQPVPHSKQPNVICTMIGQTASEILVGGHFDSIETGMGAVDDWSGAVLLPSLYQSLDSKPRRHRFVFVGFAGEEAGLHGSGAYVNKLTSDERSSLRAMVNLECLGLSPPKAWASRADPLLLQAYVIIASSLHLEPRGLNVDGVGDDDSHPFLNAKVPVITIHSLTQDTLGILHNPRDNLKAIHPDDYYSAYRLAAAYLAYLDSTLP